MSGVKLPHWLSVLLSYLVENASKFDSRVREGVTGAPSGKYRRHGPEAVRTFVLATVHAQHEQFVTLYIYHVRPLFKPRSHVGILGYS